jgi:site-specific recombinase XerD
MRQAGEDRHGLRIRALIAVLWRGGLRISERSRSSKPMSTSEGGRC